MEIETRLRNIKVGKEIKPVLDEHIQALSNTLGSESVSDLKIILQPTRVGVKVKMKANEGPRSISATGRGDNILDALSSAEKTLFSKLGVQLEFVE